MAVVGAGPAGFYAAAALLHQEHLATEVTLLDRLPTPYGLVRAGVAPDHQSIKGVVRVYEQIAADPRFGFLGNVELGRDVSAEELGECFDQVVYAVGNEHDRRLGIPGEHLLGVTPATVFVGWINAHPDYRAAQFELSHPTVAVVGNGNVAVDVARVLAHSGEELARTDLADHALLNLAESRVERIVMLGRRGPLEAAFTPAELRELAELESARLTVEPSALALDPESSAELAACRPKDPRRRNYEILLAASAAGRTAPRTIECRFLVSPVEFLGDGSGRVRAVRLERNELVRDARGSLKARGTGEYQELEVGWVFVSIGYEGRPLPGVPYDTAQGVIANRDGRVIEPANGEPLVGQYCVGWARTGARGLIASHKAASAEVVRSMLADAAAGLPAGERGGYSELARRLATRGQRTVTFDDFRRIDAAEVERGVARGAPRVKFAEVEPMLDLVELQRRGW